MIVTCLSSGEIGVAGRVFLTYSKSMAKKVSKKRSIPWLLIIILLTVVGSVLLYISQQITPTTTEFATQPTPTEEERIMSVAQGDNTTNEINGIKVNYVFGKQIGEYAIVRAVPLQNETDPLQIVLQKVNGKWQVIDSGTSFPELEGKVPSELFE